MRDWLTFFLIGYGLPPGTWVLVQLYACYWLEGRWRIAAMIPGVFMIVVMSYAFSGYFRGQTLWWMTPVMFAPGALVTLLAMISIFFIRKRTPGYLILPYGIVSVAIVLGWWGGYAPWSFLLDPHSAVPLPHLTTLAVVAILLALIGATIVAAEVLARNIRGVRAS